jgi:hypothetical protein
MPIGACADIGKASLNVAKPNKIGLRAEEVDAVRVFLLPGHRAAQRALVANAGILLLAPRFRPQEIIQSSTSLRPSKLRLQFVRTDRLLRNTSSQIQIKTVLFLRARVKVVQSR